MSETLEQDKESKHTNKPVEVVRCKYCKFGTKIQLSNGVLIKCITGRHHAPDWYCADGEE